MGRTVVEVPLSGQEPWQPELGTVSGLDLHAQYDFEPAGGDLFDAVRVGPRLAFLLTDIAGRRPKIDGISLAMQKAFRASALELLSAPGANLMEGTEMLVHAINQALIGAAKGICFAPTMIGCYDPQLGILAYINAGGQTAFFRDSEGTRALPDTSVPLGLFSHLPYDATMQAFEPGAILLVVTKGVTEGLAGGNSSGPERIGELLQRSQVLSAVGLCQAVLDAAHLSEKHRWNRLPFRGTPVREDRTALAMVRSIQPQ